MPRESFDTNLFVGRRKLLKELEKWANDSSPAHRLWSIVAPPGTGKSWLMEKVRERLENSTKSRCVFRADLSRDLETDRQVMEINLLWLEKQTKYAQSDKRCSTTVRSFPKNTSFEACLDALVDDLCNKCKPAFAPILLVDGFDEVMDDQKQSWLEERLFLRFLGRKCTRILLARRDEYKLASNQLKWREEVKRLEVLATQENEGKKQLNKRRQHKNASLDAQTVLDLIPPYQWDHPAINTNLFDRAVTNHQNGYAPLLNCDDLKACLEEIVRPNELTQHAFDRLVELAHLENDGDLLDEWTDHDLAMLTGKRLEDDSGLDQLLNFGLVLEVGGPYRKIGNGIRELARAWQRCKNIEAI